MTEVARYLGPHITPSQSSTYELPRRLEAASCAFYSMGRFWSLKTPHRWKRTVFIGLVVNSLYSALEAFILSERQENRLDAHLARLLRVAMCGEATTWHADGSATTMSAAAVLRHWRIPSSSRELLVRRLRWYQTWAARPQHHAQLLAALFGQLPCDLGPPPCSESGLTEEASPWTTRVGQDIGRAIPFLPD